MSYRKLPSIIALIAVFVVTVALSNKALAGEVEDTYISDLGTTALTALQEDDTATMLDAQAELYDVTQDEDTNPQCRIYAEVVLGATILLEEQTYYPESLYLKYLIDNTLETLKAAKNDCLLSI